MAKLLKPNVQQPIGIFDSGIGGLSVFKEIQKKIPNENLIYMSDSLYAPYGLRSEAKIRERSIAIVEFLIKQNVKAIVVACNTATAIAVESLRAQFDLPIIAIEPAIKLSEAYSKKRKIGIIATKGTIESERFKLLVAKYKKDMQVTLQIGTGLVEQIEDSETSEQVLQNTINVLVAPLIKKEIDGLILGCTHYPLVKKMFKKSAGSGVELFETGAAVARHLETVLQKKTLLNKAVNTTPQYQFFTSGKTAKLKTMVEHYLSLANKSVNFG